MAQYLVIYNYQRYYIIGGDFCGIKKANEGQVRYELVMYKVIDEYFKCENIEVRFLYFDMFNSK